MNEPHPVEEAVALTPERIVTAVERLKLLLAIEGAHQSPRNTVWEIKVTGSDLDALLSALERQREALEQAAARFRHYEQLHAAKGTPDGDAKAQNNADMAEVCERARSALGGQHG